MYKTEKKNLKKCRPSIVSGQVWGEFPDVVLKRLWDSFCLFHDVAISGLPSDKEFMGSDVHSSAMRCNGWVVSLIKELWAMDISLHKLIKWSSIGQVTAGSKH